MVLVVGISAARKRVPAGIRLLSKLAMESHLDHGRFPCATERPWRDDSLRTLFSAPRDRHCAQSFGINQRRCFAQYSDKQKGKAGDQRAVFRRQRRLRRTNGILKTASASHRKIALPFRGAAAGATSLKGFQHPKGPYNRLTSQHL